MSVINIHAAKTHLSRLVDAVAAGQEVVIARAGKPVARLVPFAEPPKSERRRLGVLAGQLKVPADFDKPLSDEELDRFEAP
jgi:prevent-host-death family protein